MLTTVAIDLSVATNFMKCWAKKISDIYGVDILELKSKNMFLICNNRVTTKQIVSILNDKDFWLDVTPKENAVPFIEHLNKQGYEVYITLPNIYGYEYVQFAVNLCIRRWFSYFVSDICIVPENILLNMDVYISDNIYSIMCTGNKNSSRILYRCSYDEFDDYCACVNKYKIVSAYNWYDIMSAILSARKE